MNRSASALLLGALALVACAAEPPASSAQPGVGPSPTLPPPHEKHFIPTVNIAPARGWPQGAMPHAPAGFKVTAFATGLSHPRWVYVLPNGDVLVAESNRPPAGRKARCHMHPRDSR